MGTSVSKPGSGYLNELFGGILMRRAKQHSAHQRKWMRLVITRIAPVTIALVLAVLACALSPRTHIFAAGELAAIYSDGSLELNIESCVASSNSVQGVAAHSTSTGAAIVRVSNSTISNNAIGMHNFGSPAVLLSRGNNTIEGNGTDTSGTIGSYTAK